jgi:hypothetical protein
MTRDAGEPPQRFSISPSPMKQSFASIPGPLRYSRECGPVVLRCVWLERFPPRKSDGALRPPLPPSLPTGGCFGLKLFIEAQASISVPSTENS